MTAESLRRWIRSLSFLRGSRSATVGKALVSLGILIAFAILIDYATLGQLAREMRPAYLAALALLSFLRIGIAAVRFRVLTRMKMRIPLRSLIRHYFVAAYFNNLLPTVIGGDAVRLFMLADCGLPKREGAVYILIERTIGSVSLVLLALAGVLAYPVSPGIKRVVIGMAILAAIGTGVFLAGKPLYLRLALRHPALERAFAALALLSQNPRALLWALILSVAFQMASIALSWLVALAFEIELSFLACLALVPLVWLITLLPISIGGIGLREVSFAYFFGTMDIPTEASLLISLGTFAALILPGGVGAWLFFRDSVLRALPKATRAVPGN